MESYERAKKLLEVVTFPTLRKRLEREITDYETESRIIELFVNHPDLQEEQTKDGRTRYVLPMRFVSLQGERYEIVDGKISCGPACRENYVESWRNIGTEHHGLYVDNKTTDNGYWLLTENTLEQIENQDKLEEICKQLNLMKKNYF